MSSIKATALWMQVSLAALALALALALSSCSWNPKNYVVRAGDTLHLIAWRYNLKTDELASWNGIDNPDLIYPGQKLRLSAPPSHGRRASTEGRKASRSPPARQKIFDKARNQDWAWPVSPTGGNEIIETFSWDGSDGVKGISIAGHEGAPVLAARSGTVVYVGDEIFGYGNMLIIQHDEVLLSAYGHNEEVLVKQNQWVEQGEKIALMGKSETDRVKLYFEIRRDSKPIDPQSLLP